MSLKYEPSSEPGSSSTRMSVNFMSVNLRNLGDLKHWHTYSRRFLEYPNDLWARMKANHKKQSKRQRLEDSPGPRRSLSFKLSDTRVYEPQIRALREYLR